MEINTSNAKAEITVDVELGGEFQAKHKHSLDTPSEADGHVDLNQMDPNVENSV